MATDSIIDKYHVMDNMRDDVTSNVIYNTICALCYTKLYRVVNINGSFTSDAI